jgi:hypothetical protein
LDGAGGTLAKLLPQDAAMLEIRKNDRSLGVEGRDEVRVVFHRSALERRDRLGLRLEDPEDLRHGRQLEDLSNALSRSSTMRTFFRSSKSRSVAPRSSRRRP